MNALVVPTNAPDRLVEFLEAWTPWPWDRVVVVLDTPTAGLRLSPALEAMADRIEVFSWTEIDAMLPDPSIVSRNDSAIRSFGFWRAWASGAEVIFTLDDDCFPAEDDFVAEHRTNLFRTPAWQSSVPGLQLRGLPYRSSRVLPSVYVSMGLWRGSLDLDSVVTLAGAHDGAALGEVRTRVMPPAQYFPFCGMNVAFRREAACLMYAPPMGLGQPFARFDDIWCGLVVQRIFRHLGWSITCGRPVIDHRRASNPFANLAKEAPGIVANEALWETIDAIELSADEPRACMEEVGASLAASDDAYLASWGRNVAAWCELFETADEPLERSMALRS